MSVKSRFKNSRLGGRLASVKQREEILLRGRAARPASLGPGARGRRSGEVARAVQEGEQVIGVHVVKLENNNIEFVKTCVLQRMTHIPVAIVFSNDGRGVKVQILDVEVCFDIIGKIFSVTAT